MRYEDPKAVGPEGISGGDARDQILREADIALGEIQVLLARLREIAEQATDPAANREVLRERFDGIKAEIDAIAAEQCARWSAAEATHLRKLVAQLDSAEL